MGSEGKGEIVHALANDYDIHVRVGAPNAGHTFRTVVEHESTEGDVLRTWKMQSVPVGWTNPKASLIIGRGALVNPEILWREIEAIRAVGVNLEGRLQIDARAGILDPTFHIVEGGVEGELHRRIGSTGEGVGAARIARIARDPEHFYFFKDLVERDPKWAPYYMSDTVDYLRRRNIDGARILLEGAQGVSLSLIHGPWPYCTSTDCGAAQLAADVGLPPQHIDRIVCVLRAYPIRVAGNSGPLKNELSWDQISEQVGRDVEERTTVTNKVRRIGEWDDALVDLAVQLNQPTSFALTFLDYLEPTDEGETDWNELTNVSTDFISYVEHKWGIPVSMVGTGGTPCQVIRNPSQDV